MIKEQIVALEARNKRNFKQFAVYSGIFLSAFMLSGFHEALAMESDDVNSHIPASKKAASTAYDQIKENFRVVVDGSRGRVTWRHWDMFKGNLFRHLDDSRLDQNGIWGNLKEDFRVQLVDARTGVQWTDWDQLTQRSGQGVKLHTILQDLVNSRTPASQAYAPYLPEGRYLYTLKVIEDALENKKSKGTVIPFFGDWDRFDEKNPGGFNGMGMFSNFCRIPKGPGVSFVYGDEVFHADNVEVPFQVLKCHILGTPDARQWDQQTVKKLITTLTPDASKQLGRQNFIFDQSYLWGMELIMETLVRQKFTSFEPLKEALEYTGEAHLVEGNKWNDSNWGMPFDGTTLSPGCNKLGKMLMKIRDENRKGSPVATPISIEDLKKKTLIPNR